MVVLGIDPGVHCGMAWLKGGKLESIETVAPHRLLTQLSYMASRPVAVVFEDSRRQSHVWKADGRSKAAGALKIARNLGMVDGICAQIAAWCKDEGVRYVAVSPSGKGGKISAETFALLTGWTKRSNQHERDACIVAWPYRNLFSHVQPERSA